MIIKITKLFFVFGLLFLRSNLHADEAPNPFDLSFEELFKLKVNNANITGMENAKVPASVTVITKVNINSGCFRNLNDLLETYVPGLIWMNDYDGPHIGMRGIISDRNTKLLLLVNGVNANLKAHNGVTSEIEALNLDDIQSIEIIRGPGSATYGPGAAAGIINITTKNGVNSKGINGSLGYLPDYNSKKASISYGFNQADLDVFLYAGMAENKGSSKIRQFRMSDGSGYFIGEEGPMKNQIPQDYMADYNNLPQLKLNAEINYTDEWSFRARFTREGGTTGGALAKTSPQVGFDQNGYAKLGGLYNIKQTQTQRLSFSINYNKVFNSVTFLQSAFNYDIEDYARRNEYFKMFNTTNAPGARIMNELADINHLRNKLQFFSESETSLRSILNYHGFDDFKLAFGFEFTRNKWASPMGEASSNFRLGDYYNIISGTDSPIWDGDSVYYDNPGLTTSTPVYFVGSGWSTNCISLLFEGDYQISAEFNAIISARYDKDDYSRGLFSPRFALIWEKSKSEYLKFIACRSNRMNTSAQLYQQHVAGTKSDPETLTGMELIYLKRFNDDYYLEISGFANQMDVLSWYDPLKSTRLTGTLNLFGIELTAQYKTGDLNIGLNHSFTKQISWKLADSVFSSGISYSDYHIELPGNDINSYGNDINNIPVNFTKCFLDYKLFSDQVIIHADVRYIWDFKGNKAGIQAVIDAAKGNPDETVMAAEMNSLIREKAYENDLKINLGVQFKIIKNIDVNLFALNLIKYNSKRYTYDAAVKFQNSYFMGGFVEEPTCIGLLLKYNL